MFNINHREDMDTILRLLKIIIFKENLIMATLSDIAAAVSAETSVDNSIVTLLNSIVLELQAAQASNDPAAMDAVVASIEANTKILSDAVTANTPAPVAAQ